MEDINALLSRCASGSLETRIETYRSLTEKFSTSQNGDWGQDINPNVATKIIKNLMSDMCHTNKNFSYEALGFLGCYLANENLMDLIAVEEEYDVFDKLIKFLQSATDKQVLTRGLWSLAQSKFGCDIYSTHVAKILSLTTDILKSDPSSTIIYETVQVMKSVIESTPVKMLDSLDVWLPQVFPYLFHDEIRIRGLVYSCFNLCKGFNEQEKAKTKFNGMISPLIPQLRSEYCKKMSQYVDEECTITLKIWRLLVLVIGKDLHTGTTLINGLLEVVEKAFKSTKFEFRVDAFKCWHTLISNFATDTEVLAHPRRIKLLIAPFKSNNAKTEEIAYMKLMTWWFLVSQLADKAISNFDAVVAPLLKFSFNSNLPSHAAVNERKLLLSNAVSPCRKYSSLHIKIAEMLALIISFGQNVPLADYKFTINLVTHPVINSGLFLKHCQLLYGCIEDALSMLDSADMKQQKLALIILQATLQHVVTYVKINQNKKESVDLVKELFSTVAVVESHCTPGDSRSLFIYKFLQFATTGDFAFPKTIMNSRLYHIPTGTKMRDLMNGTLSNFFIHKLCRPTLLHFAPANKEFTELWEAILQKSKPSDRLVFIETVIEEMKDAVQHLCPQNAAVLVSLWIVTAKFLDSHIEETQLIDQGNGSEHDWGCIYNTLLFPINCFQENLTSIDAVTYENMMSTWDALWNHFSSRTPFATTAEPNSESEYITRKIVSKAQENLTAHPDTVDFALTFFADITCAIVEHFRFTELGKRPKKLLQSPLKPNKKPHPLVNLRGAVDLLVLLLEKAVCMISPKRNQIMLKLCIAASQICKNISYNRMVWPLITSMNDSVYKALQINPTAKFSPDVERKFVEMWSSFCYLVENRIGPKATKEQLTFLAPLFYVALQSSHSGIRQRTRILWANAFASTPHPIPDSLFEVLKGVGLPPASLSEISEGATQSQSLSPKENIPLAGSFLNREKKKDGSAFHTPKLKDKKVPLAPRSSANKSENKMKLSIGLDEMREDDFVKVNSPKMHRRILTPHQADKMRHRASDIPALYSDMSQSLSQLPSQFMTQDSIEHSVLSQSTKESGEKCDKQNMDEYSMMSGNLSFEGMVKKTTPQMKTPSRDSLFDSAGSESEKEATPLEGAKGLNKKPKRLSDEFQRSFSDTSVVVIDTESDEELGGSKEKCLKKSKTTEIAAGHILENPPANCTGSGQSKSNVKEGPGKENKRKSSIPARKSIEDIRKSLKGTLLESPKPVLKGRRTRKIETHSGTAGQSDNSSNSDLAMAHSVVNENTKSSSLSPLASPLTSPAKDSVNQRPSARSVPDIDGAQTSITNIELESDEEIPNSQTENLKGISMTPQSLRHPKSLKRKGMYEDNTVFVTPTKRPKIGKSPKQIFPQNSDSVIIIDNDSTGFSASDVKDGNTLLNLKLSKSSPEEHDVSTSVVENLESLPRLEVGGVTTSCKESLPQLEVGGVTTSCKDLAGQTISVSHEISKHDEVVNSSKVVRENCEALVDNNNDESKQQLAVETGKSNSGIDKLTPVKQVAFLAGDRRSFTEIDVSLVDGGEAQLSEKSFSLLKSPSSTPSKVTRSGRRIVPPKKDMPEPMTPPGNTLKKTAKFVDRNSSDTVEVLSNMQSGTKLLQKRIADQFGTAVESEISHVASVNALNKVDTIAAIKSKDVLTSKVAEDASTYDNDNLKTSGKQQVEQKPSEDGAIDSMDDEAKKNKVNSHHYDDITAITETVLSASQKAKQSGDVFSEHMPIVSTDRANTVQSASTKSGSNLSNEKENLKTQSKKEKRVVPSSRRISKRTAAVRARENVIGKLRRKTPPKISDVGLDSKLKPIDKDEESCSISVKIPSSIKEKDTSQTFLKDYSNTAIFSTELSPLWQTALTLPASVTSQTSPLKSVTDISNPASVIIRHKGKSLETGTGKTSCTSVYNNQKYKIIFSSRNITDSQVRSVSPVRTMSEQLPPVILPTTFPKSHSQELQQESCMHKLNIAPQAAVSGAASSLVQSPSPISKHSKILFKCFNEKQKANPMSGVVYEVRADQLGLWNQVDSSPEYSRQRLEAGDGQVLKMSSDKVDSKSKEKGSGGGRVDSKSKEKGSGGGRVDSKSKEKGFGGDKIDSKSKEKGSGGDKVDSKSKEKGSGGDKVDSKSKEKGSGGDKVDSKSKEKGSGGDKVDSKSKEKGSGGDKVDSKSKEKGSGGDKVDSKSKEKGSGGDKVDSKSKEKGSGGDKVDSQSKEKGSGGDKVDSKSKERGSGGDTVGSKSKEKGSGGDKVDSKSKEKGSSGDKVDSKNKEKGFGRDKVDSKSKEKGSGGDKVDSKIKEKGSGGDKVDSKSKEKGSGRDKVDSTSKEKGSGGDKVDSKIKEKGSGGDKVDSKIKEKGSGVSISVKEISQPSKFIVRKIAENDLGTTVSSVLNANPAFGISGNRFSHISSSCHLTLPPQGASCRNIQRNQSMNLERPVIIEKKLNDVFNSKENCCKKNKVDKLGHNEPNLLRNDLPEKVLETDDSRISDIVVALLNRKSGGTLADSREIRKKVGSLTIEAVPSSSVENYSTDIVDRSVRKNDSLLLADDHSQVSKKDRKFIGRDDVSTDKSNSQPDKTACMHGTRIMSVAKVDPKQKTDDTLGRKDYIFKSNSISEEKIYSPYKRDIPSVYEVNAFEISPGVSVATYYSSQKAGGSPGKEGRLPENRECITVVQNYSPKIADSELAKKISSLPDPADSLNKKDGTAEKNDDSSHKAVGLIVNTSRTSEKTCSPHLSPKKTTSTTNISLLCNTNSFGISSKRAYLQQKGRGETNATQEKISDLPAASICSKLTADDDDDAVRHCNKQETGKRNVSPLKIVGDSVTASSSSLQGMTSPLVKTYVPFEGDLFDGFKEDAQANTVFSVMGKDNAPKEGDGLIEKLTSSKKEESLITVKYSSSEKLKDNIPRAKMGSPLCSPTQEVQNRANVVILGRELLSASEKVTVLSHTNKYVSPPKCQTESSPGKTRLCQGKGVSVSPQKQSQGLTTVKECTLMLPKLDSQLEDALNSNKSISLTDEECDRLSSPIKKVSPVKKTNLLREDVSPPVRQDVPSPQSKRNLHCTLVETFDTSPSAPALKRGEPQKLFKSSSSVMVARSHDNSASQSKVTKVDKKNLTINKDSPEKDDTLILTNSVSTPERKKFVLSKTQMPQSRAAMMLARAKRTVKTRSDDIGQLSADISNDPNSFLQVTPTNTPPSKRRRLTEMSSECRPWAKHEPSPGASPCGSILKKKIHEEESLTSTVADPLEQGEDSPFLTKNRRVSFADPPVSESVEIPPSPKTGKGTRAQKKLDMTQANILKDSLVFSQDSQEDDLIFIDSLDCSQPIYPALTECSDSVELLAPLLTTLSLVQSLLEVFKDRGFKTVGDFCKIAEAELHTLPVRAPKTSCTKKCLKKYEEMRMARKDSTISACKQQASDTYGDETSAVPSSDSLDPHSVDLEYGLSSNLAAGVSSTCVESVLIENSEVVEASAVCPVSEATEGSTDENFMKSFCQKLEKDSKSVSSFVEGLKPETREKLLQSLTATIPYKKIISIFYSFLQSRET